MAPAVLPPAPQPSDRAWSSPRRPRSATVSIVVPEHKAPPQWLDVFAQLAQAAPTDDGSMPLLLPVDPTIRKWVAEAVGSPFASDMAASRAIWELVSPARPAGRQSPDSATPVYLSLAQFLALCALLGLAANGKPVTAEGVDDMVDSGIYLHPDFFAIINSPHDSLQDELTVPMPAAGSISVQELPDDEPRPMVTWSPQRIGHTGSITGSSSSQSSPGDRQPGLYDDGTGWTSSDLPVGIRPDTTPYHPPPVMPPPIPLATIPPSMPVGMPLPLPPPQQQPPPGMVSYEEPMSDPAGPHPPPPVYDGWSPIENPFMRPPSPEHAIGPPVPHPHSHSHAQQQGPAGGGPQMQPHVPLALPAPPPGLAINPGHFGPNGPQGDPSLPLIDTSLETVTVLMNSHKEGFFMFRHHNYQIITDRLGAKVVRRYSDFLWLLDCLQHKYPFRQLPLLPPKSVAFNGSHMTSDNHFLDKRRKGLNRFLNSLVKHPVLAREPVVVKFLTVPSELSVWKKHARASIQDEFAGIVLDPSVAEVVPTEQVIESFRSSIKQSVEHYISFCSLLDRLGRRNEGITFDLGRFSHLLRSQTDVTTKAYHLRPVEVNGLNRGLLSMADHVEVAGKLYVDEAHGWSEGVVEDLKFHRDCLVSLQALFDRRTRLDHDNIPELEKRVQANEHRLAAIKSKTVSDAESVKAADIDRLEDAITRDRTSINSQQNRHLLIRICLRDEIAHFQQSLFDISRLHQKWAAQRVMFAELQADNWRRMVQMADVMPTVSQSTM